MNVEKKRKKKQKDRSTPGNLQCTIFLFILYIITFSNIAAQQSEIIFDTPPFFAFYDSSLRLRLWVC